MYYRISAHYKFALRQMFDGLGYQRVIVLEDDMELSADFFEYFQAAGQVMDADPSIYTVSSWNDNGQAMHVADDQRLYRTDFFPGLGWMLHDRLWAEISPYWPDSYWDDWMRLGSIRKGRESIRPEVCRTFNFGELGSSKGQFFRQYLATVRMAAAPGVDWNLKDLRYLAPGEFEASTASAVNAAVPARSPRDVKPSRKQATAGEPIAVDIGDNVYKVFYYTFDDFTKKARLFGIFPEWKDGVPRGGYRGVVTFKMHGGRAEVMLVPGPNMQVAKTYNAYQVDGI